MTLTAEEESDLKEAIMKAELANKQADTALKDEQRRWEPIKAMSAAFGAGVAVASGMIAAIAWALSHFIGHG